MYRYLFFNIRQTKIIALRLFSFSTKLEPELGDGAGPSKRLWLQPALQHYSRTRYQKSKLGMYEYIPYVPNYFCGNYFKSSSFFYSKRRSRSWPKSLTPVRAYRYIFLLELEPPRKSELVKKKSTLFTDQNTVLVGKHSTEGSHQPYQQTSFGSTYIIMWIRIQVRIKLIALHLHLCWVAGSYYIALSSSTTTTVSKRRLTNDVWRIVK